MTRRLLHENPYCQAHFSDRRLFLCYPKTPFPLSLACEREKEEALFALIGVKSGVLGWCSEHKRIKDIKRLEMFLKDDVPLFEEEEEEDDN